MSSYEYYEESESEEGGENGGAGIIEGTNLDLSGKVLNTPRSNRGRSPRGGVKQPDPAVGVINVQN